MYFDSHAHLNDPQFDADREAVIADLINHGVTNVMNVGCCRASSRDCVAMAKTYPMIVASVGTHPQDAKEVCDEVLDEYRELAKEEKVLAIGEIGLDYYYGADEKEVQRVAFEKQLQLAQELDLPVIVHSRSANGETMDILRNFPRVTGTLHCFAGSPELAKLYVKMGWYIGFTGVVTFKNARKAVESAMVVPLDRMLIETDCPFMAPEPHRGTRNDSRYVPLVAAKLAELRGIEAEEMGRITAENAKRLFRMN